jgi:hypothetical protein
MTDSINYTLAPGEALQVSTVADDRGRARVAGRWSASDPSVLHVPGGPAPEVFVTALAVGEADVVCTAADGATTRVRVRVIHRCDARKLRGLEVRR